MLAVSFFPHSRTRIESMDTLFDFELFPCIETPRLLLRELQREDAEAVFRIFSDAEVMKYYDMDVFTTIEQAEALIERQRQRFENYILPKKARKK